MRKLFLELHQGKINLIDFHEKLQKINDPEILDKNELEKIKEKMDKHIKSKLLSMVGSGYISHDNHTALKTNNKTKEITEIRRLLMDFNDKKITIEKLISKLKSIGAKANNDQNNGNANNTISDTINSLLADLNTKKNELKTSEKPIFLDFSKLSSSYYQKPVIENDKNKNNLKDLKDRNNPYNPYNP